MMMANFSHSNLSNNPKYDFVKTLLSQSDDENDFLIEGSPYNLADISCNYLSETDYISKYAGHLFPSILSLNIQSLPAKFNLFCEFIYSLQSKNCSPDVICLQEIWRIPGCEFFNLNGYSPLEYKCRRNDAQGGGVGIYVKKGLTYNVNPEL